MPQGSKPRTREQVLVICAFVLLICFELRASDFGFRPEPDGGTCKMRPQGRFAPQPGNDGQLGEVAAKSLRSKV